MLLFEHFGAWGGHGDWDSWKEGWYCLWSQWLEIRPFSSPQTSATQWRLFRTSHNPESSLQIQWQHERAQDWDPEDLGLAAGSTSYQSCEFWVNFLISLGCILHVKLNTIILLPTVQDYCAIEKMYEWCFVNCAGLCKYVWFLHDLAYIAAKLLQVGPHCSLSHCLCFAFQNLLTSFCRWTCLPLHWEYPWTSQNLLLCPYILSFFFPVSQEDDALISYGGEPSIWAHSPMLSHFLQTLLHPSTPTLYLLVFPSSQSAHVFRSLASWTKCILLANCLIMLNLSFPPSLYHMHF